MNLIKENIIFLQAVATLSKKQVKELLKHAEKDQIRAIGEIAKNVLTNNLRPPESYKAVMKKHRWAIRAIAEDRAAHRVRLQTIVRKPDAVSHMIRAILDKLTALTKQ